MAGIEMGLATGLCWVSESSVLTQVFRFPQFRHSLNIVALLTIAYCLLPIAIVFDGQGLSPHMAGYPGNV